MVGDVQASLHYARRQLAGGEGDAEGDGCSGVAEERNGGRTPGGQATDRGTSNTVGVMHADYPGTAFAIQRKESAASSDITVGEGPFS